MTIRNETDPITIQRVLYDMLLPLSTRERHAAQWVMRRGELDRLAGILPGSVLGVSGEKWRLLGLPVRVSASAKDVSLENAPPPKAFINEKEVGLGDLSINIDQIEVTHGGNEPDPSWRHIDAAGHFHAHDEDLKLPTLTTKIEHVECDGGCGDPGGCEGFTIAHYHCRICDEEIRPGSRPAYGRSFEPGLMSWRVIIKGDARLLGMTDANVSVRIINGDHEYFGVGVPVEYSRTVGDLAELSVEGTGPLGRRKAA